MAQEPQEPQGRKIRRVTGVDVIRAAQGQAQAGAYQFELELDGGVDEYLLTPAQDEMSSLLRLFRHSAAVLLDQRTEELTFEDYGGPS